MFWVKLCKILASDKNSRNFNGCTYTKKWWEDSRYKHLNTELSLIDLENYFPGSISELLFHNFSLIFRNTFRSYLVVGDLRKCTIITYISITRNTFCRCSFQHMSSFQQLLPIFMRISFSIYLSLWLLKVFDYCLESFK